jgi:hypothetical protein
MTSDEIQQEQVCDCGENAANSQAKGLVALANCLSMG